MDFNHKPVLLNECLDSLNIRPDGVYVDGTIGGAGHSAEIFRMLDGRGILIGLDQDAHALEVSRERIGKIGGQAKLILEHTNFKHIKEICHKNGINEVDGILLDLGVSSYQFDTAERGFSYQKNAPLDMRMDRRNELNAEAIVNEYDEGRIYRIIRDYGEEKWASRIAAFIVEARRTKRINTTFELVNIIKSAIPSSARREGPHPAKRTFQALRIAVNDELSILQKTIDDAVGILKKNGRFCIMTFHSLEDRIVKNEFKKNVNPCTCPEVFPVCICGKKPKAEYLTKKPIMPTDDEVNENPRSRSAKLRVIKKI